MNLTCKDHWKSWHKSIKQTELSLQVTPSADIGISPAQLLFGRPMRKTFHEINNILELEEDEPRRRLARLAALRIRKMTKQQDEKITAGSYTPTIKIFTVAIVGPLWDQSKSLGNTPREQLQSDQPFNRK